MNPSKFFNIQEIEYYFDRIIINSEILPEHLRELIDSQEIKSHCKKIRIWEASNTAKHWDYQSRIDILDATDQCMKHVKGYDLARHGITHIEIKKQITFESSSEAERYRLFEKNHRHKKWGRDSFSVLTTLYKGKIKGEPTRTYFKVYRDKKDPCVIHCEFVIEIWANVKDKLGINSLYDLLPAEEIFDDLEDRYLKYMKPNKTRLQKLMKMNPAPYPIVPETIDEVADWMSGQKKEKQDYFYMSMLLNKSKRLWKRLSTDTKKRQDRKYVKGQKYFRQINSRYTTYFLTKIDNTDVKTM